MTASPTKATAPAAYVAADEEVAAQYDTLTQLMARAGYHHYEISNYARPGREAVHNSSYWNRTPYIGFGPAAASLTDGVRTTNTRDVGLYISSRGAEKELVEALDEREVAEEVVMLGMRTSRGVDAQDVPEAFRREFIRLAESERKKENIEDAADGRLRIPEGRWMVSDMIIRGLTDF